MAEEVIMPKAGSEMTEGEIVQWFKKEGEQVKEGEPLLEIVTDKVNMEVEASESGTLLKILAPAGSVVPVVSTIAWIGEEGEEVPESESPAPAAKAEEKKPEATPTNDAATKEEMKEVIPPSISNTTESAPAKRERVGEYDVCVVGGGPAGYVAAIKAAQLGGKVAIVEKDTALGGTCLNRGCIPSKAYLHNAEIIESIKEASSRGIKLVNEEFKVDMPESVQMKNKVVRTLTGGIAGLMKSYGVTVFNGVGKLRKDKKVVVNGSEIIDADRVIIAGGSKIKEVPIPGSDSPNVINSDDILDIQEVPKRLAVIGGGIIACELGQAFAAFGSEVTIVYRSDRLIRLMDPDASKVLTKHFEKQGIKVLTNAPLKGFEDNGNGVTVKIEGKDDVVVDKVLLAIGRVPDLSAVEDVDIKIDRGAVVVNDKMETSIEGVYAPGDINARKMLAHAAFRMGEVAAENAMGHSKTADLHAVPSAMYTNPEVASVGLTEEEAKKNYDIKVGRFNFAANGRALASNAGEGFIKVIIDAKYHEILGVHIAGPIGAEIINEAATFIQSEMTIEDVIDSIHGHPTFSEVLYEACTDCLNQCIHAPKKKD